MAGSHPEENSPINAAGAPDSDIDLYSDESLKNPYGVYAELRATGRAVWLRRLSMYALPHYAEVKEALGDWEVYSSARGVALNDAANAVRWGLITLDPPEHDQAREIVMKPLTTRQLKAVSTRIEEAAEDLAAEVAQKQTFEGMTELAQRLPLLIVGELVGLSREGQERMLEWGASVGFDALGPENERTENGLQGMPGLRDYIEREVLPDTVSPNSWAASLFEQAEEQSLPLHWAQRMMGNYVLPSLDTTIHAIGNALWLFALNPDQWTAMRANPNLINRAINEVLRMESPVQSFTRVLTRDHEIDGVVLPEGSRALVMFASANRDEDYWHEPNRFDIHREGASTHMAFGFGQHVCIGQGLARLELRAQFAALTRRIERIELLGAERTINNILRGFDRLDLRVSQPRANL